MSETPEKPVARIVTDQPREKVVKLAFPVEFDGKTYDTITLRRITGAEALAYIDAVQGAEKRVMPPVLTCPVEVFEALDADDFFALEEQIMDFLPRKFREAAASI